MSDNPQVLPPPFFRLGFGVIALTGPDAVKFAHAQCMSDVAALAPGHWQWSGWLTPKGRVIALFALLKLDAETLWLLLPDCEAGDLAARLRRFVFRSKVAIETRDDLTASGAFAAPAVARDAKLDGDARRGVELDFGAAGGARVVRLGNTPAPADTAALARWRRFDLQHGLPRLDASQREQWTPQMLSLDRLRAYSVKKGCYPGQEIVARTHFLGQAKRGLALLVAEALIAPGDAVSDGTRVLGAVISVASGTTALAVVAPEQGEASLLIAGKVPASEDALLDGLAR